MQNSNKTETVGNNLYIKFSVFAYFVFLISIVASRSFPIIGQLKYFVPIGLILYLLLNRALLSFSDSKETLLLILFWFAWFILGPIIGPDFKLGFFSQSFKEFFFIISPFVTILVIGQHWSSQQIERIIFFTMLALLVLEISIAGFNISNILSIQQFLVHSYTESETPYALAYGAIFIYYLSKGNVLNSLIALYLTALGGKRIAVGAVIIIFICYHLLKYLYLNRPKLLRGLIFLSNFFIVIFFFMIANHYFDELVLEYTGLPIQGFTKGRATIYEIVLQAIEPFTLFGNGVAYSTYALFPYPRMGLLQSDVLKVYVETGLIGFLIFFNLFYGLGKSFGAFLILVYLNIIMISGNPLIYFHITLIVFLLVLALNKQNEK